MKPATVPVRTNRPMPLNPPPGRPATSDSNLAAGVPPTFPE